MVNRVEDYKSLLSKDEEYGSRVELTCISCLFSNYLFRVHYEISTSNVDYDIESIVCHSFFLLIYNAGHF